MQQPLFVDSIYEALQQTVMGIGGMKRVGAMLWPALPVDRAGRELADCLNQENARKLSLDEIEAIFRVGRESNVHIGMSFLAERCGYARPTPIDPETEKQRLQREFVEGVSKLERIAGLISAAEARANTVPMARRG